MPEDHEENHAGSWVDVGRYDSLDEAYDHGLVILAMGESCRVLEGKQLGEYELQAEAEVAAKISEELEEFAAENRERKQPPISPSNWAKHPAGWLYFIAWAGLLLGIFHWQGLDPSLADRGASSSIGLIGRGEWWRPFTALFLHADGPHIVGNLASGMVFGGMVSKSLGPLKAWTMILLAGTMGNALTSWLTYPQPFSSLGASTAVFGALGILSGIGIMENIREPVRMPWVRICAPLLAGLVLLGWLGGAAPDSGVDVFGHVFGFGSGVIAGVACRLPVTRIESLHGS
ncbi:MAG: rhomboid family intramembrane serine protease [Armatimonadetes bacterium]|nr:rhomboid family intramembrane serine protease [Akkermansiaceae bacterium]